MNQIRTFVIALTAAMITGAPALAIVGGDPPPADEYRFDAVAAFSFKEWLNGDVYEHNHFCCGTLIAPDKVLLARHCLNNHPPDSVYWFRFRRNIDGSIGDISQGWESFYHAEVDYFIFPETNPAGQDIVIAKLVSPVEHIEPMAIAELDAYAVGDPIQIAGWGEDEQHEPTHELRVTPLEPYPNELTSIPCSLVTFYGYSDQGNPCDCGPAMHDSGGAVVIETAEGEIQLIGVIGSYVSATRPQVHEEIGGCYYEDECFDTGYFCADLDGDGDVDVADLLALYGAWGDCPDPPEECPADFNGDGVVGVADQLLLLGQLGEYCPCPFDLDGDGDVDTSDLLICQSLVGDCPCDATNDCKPADFNDDAVVDGVDMDMLIDHYGPCPG
jgi:hypothetical protein